MLPGIPILAIINKKEFLMSRPKKVTLCQIRSLIKVSVVQVYSKYQTDKESNSNLTDDEYLKWFCELWDDYVANECYFIVRDPLCFHIIFDLITSVINQQNMHDIGGSYVYEIGFRVLALYCLYFSQPILSNEQANKLRVLTKVHIRNDPDDSSEIRKVKLLARKAIDFEPEEVCGSPIRLTKLQLDFFIDQLTSNREAKIILYKKCLNKIDQDGGFCICKADPLTVLYELDPLLLDEPSEAEFITSLKEREKIVDEATSQIQAIRKEVQAKEEDLDLNLRVEMEQVGKREREFWETNTGNGKFVIKKFTHQLRNSIGK